MINKTIQALKRAYVLGSAKALRVLALLFVFALPLAAKADYSIATVDSNGNVTFTPGALVVPILTGVAAGIVSAAGLVVLWVGARWLFRVLKGAK